MFFSVDVETSGPVPGRYSLLSIGACRIDDPTVCFYAELRPESPGADPDALAVSGLSMDRLAAEGETASEALHRFAEWVEEATPPGDRPVFVAFNAAFDWMFVAEALKRHVGRNPFGHAPLDVKALAMGSAGLAWSQTSFSALARHYGLDAELPHHALEDARLQARLFTAIIATGPGGSP